MATQPTESEASIAALRVTRPQFLSSLSLLAGGPALAACSASNSAYRAAVGQTWRPFDVRLSAPAALQRELVRYATLAPSSHNTQCWRFKLEAGQISISPDAARRCPAVDPDDHHLFVSLGCATENLVQAALAHGLASEVAFEPAAGGVIRVRLEPARAVASPLFSAIPLRQCSRCTYDGRPVPNNELRLLEAAGSGNGVRVLLLTARAQLETVLDYVVRGNTAQMNDPRFMAELLHWIRFDDAEAIATRDGLFTRASGNPVMPRPLGRFLSRFFFTAESENTKYAAAIRSSAGIAVFSSERSDPAHWVEAGRAYERFVLQATASGIRTAMINQPVEVAPLRPEFASRLGLAGRRPDLVVRFGYGPQMPRSLRRPVDAVLS
jgi:hypothetical protein